MTRARAGSQARARVLAVAIVRAVAVRWKRAGCVREMIATMGLLCVAASFGGASYGGVAPEPEGGTGWAVVYHALRGGHNEIRYRSLSHGGDRLLYEVRGASRSLYLTREFGYLPSPDGRWLLVWETPPHPDYRFGDRTWWRLVSIPEGRMVDLGQTDGRPWLLPYWQDSNRLAFEGDVTLLPETEATAIYDLAVGKWSRPLSSLARAVPADMGSLREWVDRTRLTRYAQRHHVEELGALQRALFDVPGEATGLWVYFATGVAREPEEYALLRNLGLPAWEGLHAMAGLSRAFYPRIAPAPGGSKAAVAVVREGPLDAAPDARLTKAACLDVYLFPPGGGQGAAQRLQTLSWTHGTAELTKLDVPPPSPVHGMFQPSFSSLRWSRDGRYLSYGTFGVKAEVIVLDASTWQEVLRVEDAANAFLVPAARLRARCR